jgi:hypothetical protein
MWKHLRQYNKFFLTLAIALAVGFFAMQNAFADNSGTFVSEIVDTGHGNVSWGNLEWTAAAPAGTQIVLKVRTSNSDTMSSATEFSSCSAVVTVNSANTTGTAATSSNSCVHSGDRYYQYEATLSSTNDDVPELQEAKVNYSYYTPSPTSSIANDTDSDFNRPRAIFSNVFVNGSGTNAVLALLRPNHAICTNDSDCVSGSSCGTDFATATKYCHTSSYCADSSETPWQRSNGFEKCSGNDWFKSCTDGTWGAQQNNPNSSDSYCDAGGGAQSGYKLASSYGCTSGSEGGFDDGVCTSCIPYIAATTSSCKTTCSSDSDCYSNNNCASSVCKKAGGQSCSSASECASNTCSDNVCAAMCSKVACGSTCGFDGLTYSTVEGADGRCWFDRNLGATQVATSSTDYDSYGWYYQWGRGNDGHQIPTSSTTSTLATSNTPGHANFIITSDSVYDWRSPPK